MNMRISLSCLLCLTWLIACAPTLSEQPTMRPAPTPSPTATTLALVTSVSTATNPAPTPAPTLKPPVFAPTPTPVRTAWRTSISPDGQWLAQSMAEFHDGQGVYRAQLKIMKRDGSRDWSTTQAAPIAQGYTTPQPLHWSRDGRYLYFTNRPVRDGCATFVNGSDLWRINLSTGEQMQVMPARALWLSLSPDERTIAYIAQGRPLRLVLRDVQTGNERQLTLQTENDALAGRSVWSPEGGALALTIAENSCRTGHFNYGIMHVKVATLAQTMLVSNDARLLETVEWPERDKLVLRDTDGQTWWLNPATRQLAVATLLEAPINSAQWPTFRSDALGFSLNYPPDWEITDEQQSVYLLTNETFGGGPEPIRYYVYIGEYANPKGRPFIEVATAAWSEELKRGFTFTPRLIGNYQAYEATRIPSQLGALTIFLEGDQRYLAVALTPYYDAQSPWPAQDKYVRLFRALLETIRLTR